MSNIGDHVWLITSRQTEPDLLYHLASFNCLTRCLTVRQCWGGRSDLQSQLMVTCTDTGLGAQHVLSTGHRRRALHLESASNSFSPQVMRLTLSWAFEYDIELLHVVIHQRHFVVAHHELHDICLYSSLWTAHLATYSRLSPVTLKDSSRVKLREWCRKVRLDTRSFRRKAQTIPVGRAQQT